jgi:hypothetical protein
MAIAQPKTHANMGLAYFDDAHFPKVETKSLKWVIVEIQKFA